MGDPVPDDGLGPVNDNMSANGGDNDRDDICRDFLKNICNRGSRCKFYHPPEAKMRAQEQVNFCIDFQNRGCMRENCRFVHAQRDEVERYKQTHEVTLPLARAIAASSKQENVHAALPAVATGTLTSTKSVIVVTVDSLLSANLMAAVIKDLDMVVVAAAAVVVVAVDMAIDAPGDLWTHMKRSDLGWMISACWNWRGRTQSSKKKLIHSRANCSVNTSAMKIFPVPKPQQQPIQPQQSQASDQANFNSNSNYGSWNPGAWNT
ncbi:unnamed protein product [Caenorhabditis auriculariae]|uniref:C3H1-type domain-containing protein n=1 Tax=Caenorhabditis auriculariae TaxID=2777116 RepID=A0A8S1H4N2_9PELO|nr:unnamed protein product [Caenorhabditis auriculariae]